jgi:hypothetical protein
MTRLDGMSVRGREVQVAHVVLGILLLVLLTGLWAYSGCTSAVSDPRCGRPTITTEGGQSNDGK